jgi:Domain of unknown function (DUF4268)
MGQAADFFVSCTTADRAWAEWIAWQLAATQHPNRPPPALTAVDLRNRFFRQVLDRIGQQRPGFCRPKPGSGNYSAFAAGPFGHYAVSFINDGRLRVGVLLEMQTADQTKRLFDLLVAHRANIERELGEPLDWDRNDLSIRSWLGLHRPAPSLTDEQQSTQIANWAADTISNLMVRLDGRLRMEARRLRDAPAATTTTAPPSAAAIPDTESAPHNLAPALEVASRVAADRQQRAVSFEFSNVVEAGAYRDQLRSALIEQVAAGDVAVGHVRPWAWTPTSGGRALTETGHRTGVEVRLSYYRSAHPSTP